MNERNSCITLVIIHVLITEIRTIGMALAKLDVKAVEFQFLLRDTLDNPYTQ